MARKRPHLLDMGSGGGGEGDDGNTGEQRFDLAQLAVRRSKRKMSTSYQQPKENCIQKWEGAKSSIANGYLRYFEIP